MHPSPRLVCSDRPEGHILSCLDPAATQTIPVLKGRDYPYKVLPFGVAEAAIAPMREQGVCILNYLNDWLILAHSRDKLCKRRDLLLQLGIQVWEKIKLTPEQRISFLCMELDSVQLTARLTEECIQSVLNCQSTVKSSSVVPLKLFQRLPGHMAAVVTPLGLLSMRPFPHWLQGLVQRAGVPLEQVSRQCCGRHRCLQHSLGGLVQWACNSGDLDGPSTALAHQLHLRSLSSTYIPGLLNCADDELSRQPVAQGEWSFHPVEVQMIWDYFGASCFTP
ncbi:hypothetical protein F2P79_010107 [Pimephales promelas]|nr:hypothetical protein F2P79_010107 [Pimephales promelas]